MSDHEWEMSDQDLDAGAGGKTAAADAAGDLAGLAEFIFDALAPTIMVSDDFRIQWWNRSFVEMAGHRLADCRGHDLLGTLIETTDRPRVLDALLQLPASRESVEFDSFLTTRSGDCRRVKWRFAIMRNPEDETLTLVGSAMDITELYEELQQLRKSLGGQPAAVAATPRVRGYRRVFERHPCDRNLLVAPIVDDQMPAADTFRSVRGKDVSQRGFAYYAEECPQVDQVVAVFGAAPDQSFFRARVVHTTPSTIDGRPAFIVGCCFLGRVDEFYTAPAKDSPTRHSRGSS
jgi:PAS domain S-box-containing protein